jgi:S-adenosylmethionine/arginine decarboxylase-like enzyme
MAILTIAGVCHDPYVDLKRSDWLRSWLPHIAADMGMHPVGEVIIQPYSHWPEDSPSAVLFIEESAIVVHCYGEKKYIEILLHSCKEVPLWESLVQRIAGDLGMEIKFLSYESNMDWRVRADSPPHKPETWPISLRPLTRLL